MLADLADLADKSRRLADSTVLANLAVLGEVTKKKFSGLEISGFECLALYHLAALN